MWNTAEIIGFIQDHLVRLDHGYRAQQAHSGLDALLETDLHPLLAQALTSSHLQCIQEAYFPTSAEEKRKDSSRERCDLVFLPDGKSSIYDPIHADRELNASAGTLFAHTATIREPSPDQCEPQNAYWVEVKVIAQFRYISGVPTPNARYAHELLSGPRDDVVKLASDPSIRNAGVLVVLFTEHKESGIHDLSMAMQELIEQELPVLMPEIRSLPIENYAGNEWCTLGLIPLRL